MKLRLEAKTESGRKEIERLGDTFYVLALERHVAFSRKKDWWYLESEKTSTTIHVHTNDDEHFRVVGGGQ